MYKQCIIFTEHTYVHHNFMTFLLNDIKNLTKTNDSYKMIINNCKM